MKKSLLALAALTAFAGAASAQSSVTLFGIVDQSVNSIKNGSSSQKTLASDMMNSNRFGVRGLEDLGGGLRAGFWLEAGLAPDTGAAGGGNGQNGITAFWNRRATVSLIGGFGEVRLGRDYVVTFSNRAAYDPFGFNGIAHIGLIEGMWGLSRAGMQVRANNMIGYTLPALGGVYGGVQVAAGERQMPGLVAGTGASDGNSSNKYMGARLGYAGGPVNVSGAWGKGYKEGIMTADLKEINFGASFNAGFMTISGMYDKTDYGSSGQKKFMVGVTVPFGASTLKASYNKASGNVNGVSSPLLGAKLFGIGYQYDLSKRTALYATYGSLNNDGTSANATSGANFAVTRLAGVTMTRGATSSGYNVGVRHSF